MHNKALGLGREKQHNFCLKFHSCRSKITGESVLTLCWVGGGYDHRAHVFALGKLVKHIHKLTDPCCEPVAANNSNSLIHHDIHGTKAT